MRKMIANASLALSDHPGARGVMPETGAGRSSPSTEEGDWEWLPTQ
jgi:hypothetical protein